MPIIVKCKCGKNLRAKDEFAGKRFKCPACGTAVTVPSPGATVPASPTEAPKAAPSTESVKESPIGFLPKEISDEDLPSDGDIERIIQEVLEFVDLTGEDPPNYETLLKAGDKAVPAILDAISTVRPGLDSRATYEAKARLCHALGQIGTQNAEQALAKVLEMHTTVWEHTSIVKPAAETALATIQEASQPSSPTQDGDESASMRDFLLLPVLLPIWLLYAVTWKAPAYAIAFLAGAFLSANQSDKDVFLGLCETFFILGNVFVVPSIFWLLPVALIVGSIFDPPENVGLALTGCGWILGLAIGGFLAWRERTNVRQFIVKFFCDDDSDSSSPVDPYAQTVCRFWYCSSCNAVFEKDERTLLLMQVPGEVSIRGTWECANCHAVYQSPDIYAGKHDLPEQHWAEIERDTGKSALVEV